MSKSKKIFGFLSASLLSFLISVPVFAITVDISPFQNNAGTKSPITNVDQVVGTGGLLITAVQWIYSIFFVVAVLFILIAAYNYLRGGTNPKAIETAKSQLKYAVIAIAIALVASGISLLIKGILSQ